MKILHMIDHLGLGGAQVIVKSLFENSRNNDIHLFALRKTRPAMDMNNPHVYTGSSSRKLSLRPLHEARALIEKKDVQVLHCHLCRAQVFGYLLKKLYFPHLRLIFHEHGEIFREKFLFELFLRMSEPCVDMYLAVSGAVEQRLFQKKHIPDRKIQVLQNFVDLDRFDRKKITWNITGERSGLGLGPEDFVVGFAGRLIPRKGWREFVGSAELVCNDSDKIRFLIAGHGQDEGKLVNMIKGSKYSDRIAFLGYVENMLWFYSLIDCLVIPSHWEPMSIAALEILAAGVPVIVSDTENLNKTFTDHENGLLFEPGNVRELAEKIQVLHADSSLRSELVKKGLQDIKGYSLDRYVERLYKLYGILEFTE